MGRESLIAVGGKIKERMKPVQVVKKKALRAGGGSLFTSIPKQVKANPVPEVEQRYSIHLEAGRVSV